MYTYLLVCMARRTDWRPIIINPKRYESEGTSQLVVHESAIRGLGLAQHLGHVDGPFHVVLVEEK